MLILRMLSGLVAVAWGMLPRRRNRLVTSPVPPFRAEVADRIAGTCSFSSVQAASMSALAASCNKASDAVRGFGDAVDPYLDGAGWLRSENGQRPECRAEDGYHKLDCPRAAESKEKLRKAAEWHAEAGRKAIVDLDGEGTLEHMRHFRRYSSSGQDQQYPPGTCGACGATANGRDMVSGNTQYGRRLVCIPCSGRRDSPSWTARGGKGVPVREMDDQHLVNSAMLVRRWLRKGEHPVSDDRVRMCGHVLKECARRGLDGTKAWRSRAAAVHWTEAKNG